MKYYIYRFHNGITFKRTKCNDYWSHDYKVCWQYSKQGATQIVDRLSKQSEGFYQYGIIEVDKVEEMLKEYDEYEDKQTYIAECLNERPWWI